MKIDVRMRVEYITQKIKGLTYMIDLGLFGTCSLELLILLEIFGLIIMELGSDVYSYRVG